jgi:transposase InsO family protein
MMGILQRAKLDALLHHSDQVSQHTSEKSQRLMADNGVTCSMSRSGKADVFDNFKRFLIPRADTQIQAVLSPPYSIGRRR